MAVDEKEGKTPIGLVPGTGVEPVRLSPAEGF